MSSGRYSPGARNVAALLLAGVLAVFAPSTALAAPYSPPAASPGVPVPGAGAGVVIPPEFLPPPHVGVSGDAADLLAGAAAAADYTGDKATRDAALDQLAPDERRAVQHALHVLSAPVPEPDFSDPDTHIVALGNGLNSDGSVHQNLANRLEVAKDLALRNPGAPLVMSGGETEHGHVEAEAMRDWLVDRGVPEHRIHVEGRSWSTVSNAWHTHALLPEASSLVVVTSESHVHRGVVDLSLAYGPDVRVTGAASPDADPGEHDPQGERFERYRDAVLWYVLPPHITADGLPPVFGAGIPRFF